MRIAEITDPGADWDAFVEAQPEGRLGHAAAWAHVVREAYGLQPVYLEARDARGTIAGVLPLVRFRGLGARLEFVSMPFLDSGGILSRDPAARRALLEAALALVRERGAVALELREIAREGALPRAGEPEQTRVDLVLALERDAETQWRALRAKVRNQTRKAESEGLALARGNRAQLLAEFYGPFCCNMRDLGSPPHSRRFFAAAAEAFGERLRAIVTRLGDRPVGGLVAIDFAGAVSAPWASTLREERSRCPNNQIYWEALRWAIERGAREFDFGRSPIGGGTHRFKRGWGACERPLAWERLGPDGDPLGAGAAGDNALLRRLSALWRRLPVPVTALLGPHLRGRISS